MTMLDSKPKFSKAFLIALALGLLYPGERALAADVSQAALFREQCAALALDAEQHNTMTVAGRDGPTSPDQGLRGPSWLFLGPELRHLGVGQFWGERAASVSRASKPDSASVAKATPAKEAAADPLPAILDFNDQLKKMGVTLILVPVPPKAVIYPDFIPNSPVKPGGEPPRLDSELQAFYGLLRKSGVRVIDLTPLFLANRFHADGALYCKQDSHWSGNGCVLAARAIAGELRALPGFSNQPPAELKSGWQTIEINGDLWQALGDPKPAREQMRIRQVSRQNGDSLEPDPRSPVILLGDSHNLVFHAGDDMQTRGAGLADQLALELGQAVDLVAVRGSGATPARINLLRRAQKDPAYWKGKRAVIWCFTAREFTEGDGWRKVPVMPP